MQGVGGDQPSLSNWFPFASLPFRLATYLGVLNTPKILRPPDEHRGLFPAFKNPRLPVQLTANNIEDVQVPTQPLVGVESNPGPFFDSLLPTLPGQIARGIANVLAPPSRDVTFDRQTTPVVPQVVYGSGTWSPPLVGIELNPGPKMLKKGKNKKVKAPRSVSQPTNISSSAAVRSAPMVAYGCDPTPMTTMSPVSFMGDHGIRLTTRYRAGSINTAGTLSTTGTAFLNFGGNAVNSIPLDPNQTSTQPANVYSLAQYYTKFRLVSLAVCYSGEVSSATNGSIAITYLPDGDLVFPPPLNSGTQYIQMLATENTFSARVWSPCVEKRFEVDNGIKFMVAASSDARLTTPGSLWFGSTGLTTGTYYGSIWITVQYDYFNMLNSASNTFCANVLLAGRIKGSVDERRQLARRLLDSCDEKEREWTEVDEGRPGVLPRRSPMN
jgi:hypothetical protein